MTQIVPGKALRIGMRHAPSVTVVRTSLLLSCASKKEAKKAAREEAVCFRAGHSSDGRKK